MQYMYVYVHTLNFEGVCIFRLKTELLHTFTGHGWEMFTTIHSGKDYIPKFSKKGQTVTEKMQKIAHFVNKVTATYFLKIC